MKTLYVLMILSIFVVAFWCAMASYMVYQIGKDMGAWIYIDKWIKWRYGW